jgi:hypothetical protein
MFKKEQLPAVGRQREWFSFWKNSYWPGKEPAFWIYLFFPVQ